MDPISGFRAPQHAHRRRADIERHACREPAGPTTATSSATLRKAVVIIRWTLVAPLRLREHARCDRERSQTVICFCNHPLRILRILWR